MLWWSAYSWRQGWSPEERIWLGPSNRASLSGSNWMGPLSLHLWDTLSALCLPISLWKSNTRDFAVGKSWSGLKQCCLLRRQPYLMRFWKCTWSCQNISIGANFVFTLFLTTPSIYILYTYYIHYPINLAKDVICILLISNIHFISDKLFYGCDKKVTISQLITSH